MSKKSKKPITAKSSSANDAPAKIAPKKSKKSRPATERKPSGLDAAAQVLKDAGEPMRCKDMVETMLSKGLWSTGGRTPGATIYAAVIREIAKKGPRGDSRFKKTDRGLFAFNAGAATGGKE